MDEVNSGFYNSSRAATRPKETAPEHATQRVALVYCVAAAGKGGPPPYHVASEQPVEKSGKWLIFAILAMALASGIFSWWFRWSATHRAANFWGPQAAAIRDATQVTAIRLADYDPKQVQIMSWLDDVPDDLQESSIDASQARGLTHLKQALLEDRSYAWDNWVAAEPFMARWVLAFNHNSTHQFDSRVIVMLNDACTRCCFAVDRKRSAIIDCTPMSAGLKTLLADWFAASSPVRTAARSAPNTPRRG